MQNPFRPPTTPLIPRLYAQKANPPPLPNPNPPHKPCLCSSPDPLPCALFHARTASVILRSPLLRTMATHVEDSPLARLDIVEAHRTVERAHPWLLQLRARPGRRIHAWETVPAVSTSPRRVSKSLEACWSLSQRVERLVLGSGYERVTCECHKLPMTSWSHDNQDDFGRFRDRARLF